MRCAIWYHLYNLKNVKNNHGGVLLSLKVTLLHVRFSSSLNCTTDTKSRNASHIAKSRQQYNEALNNFLMHVSDHAKKDMYTLNYGAICITVSLRG